MGEPAGVGAELVALLHKSKPLENCVLIGDEEHIKQTFDQHNTSLKNLPIKHIALSAKVKPGKLDVKNVKQVLATIEHAVNGCMSGTYSAMVTCPIHKGIINESGISFSGHTEFLAELSHTKKVVMMLLNRYMRVALASTHLPLKDVHKQITKKSLTEIINIVNRALTEDFHIKNPAIAVCGLNPHAGENGTLGMEEIDTIIPVISALKIQGVNLTGPIPADSLFTPDKLSHFDAVLAMYHDQGLTPLKYAGFGESVNMTLGLPFVRTSVDHGTALDIAGLGIANTGSLDAAISLARRCSGKT